MDFEIANHFLLCFCFQIFSLRVMLYYMMLSGFSWAWEAFTLIQIILKELSSHAFLLNTSRLGATEKKPIKNVCFHHGSKTTITAAFSKVGFCDFLLKQPAFWAWLRNEILHVWWRSLKMICARHYSGWQGTKSLQVSTCPICPVYFAI